MSNLKYRPDIDGLRAVAVILVLLYHGGLGFGGGYVGVDVFFVISGYLITGLILKQQRTGNFRMANFWNRRIRRIVPAACVMVIATLVAGSFLLFSTDYEDLATSALAQQFMVSNIFFWRDTGYFAGPADLKPLLHTWSLGVEEQFYLLYPFLLVLLGRLPTRAVVSVLGMTAIASLAISEWGARSHPSGAFYLLPSRAWELLLGGLIFLAPPSSIVKPPFNQCLSVVGVLLIVASAVVFDSSTRFPGTMALVPCCGAALLIYSNHNQLTLVGRCLACGPVVFIGLTSYSLYLWHWPILAFSRYWLGEALPTSIASLALVVSFVVALLSYHYVELPFRRPATARRRRQMLLALFVTFPLIVAASLTVVVNDGFSRPADDKAERYLAARESKRHLHDVDVEDVRSGDIPSFGATSGALQCLVWGDSHAMALMPGIVAACRSHSVHGYQATHSSTPPLLEFTHIERYGLNEETTAFSRAVCDFAKSNDIDIVILGGAWSSYVHTPGFERQLNETVTELNSAGIEVAVVLDVALQDGDVPTILARRAFFGLPTHGVGVSFVQHRSRNLACNEAIERACNGKAHVLDPAPYFVDESGRWRVEADGAVLYRDSRHLSVEGALRLRGLFERFFGAVADR